MKKEFFAFAAGLLLLVSCDHFKSASTSANSGKDAASVNDQNNNIVIRAIESGDVSKLDSVMTKDFVDHDAFPGKDVKGLDSEKVYLRSLHTYFDNLKMDILQTATSADGQSFFSNIRMKGKVTKANPWDIPVGTNIDMNGIDLIKMRDGKAAEHWGFTSQKNIDEMMMAMKGSNNTPAGKMQPMVDSTHKKM